ncbi:hypothetical protein [Hanstruepera ponticola]|uniref:hypothetical protein n=1 Tax=Hanstruepera ponticola TaxID=2042995 RepID=UPI0017859C21|nr:hypothetical protein [Hanstruepera ponticola]
MILRLKKANSTFFIIAAIGLLIAVFSSYFLPESFFIDAYIIILDKYNEIGLVGSYPFSMWFYKHTGLGSLSFPIVALIQYPILIYCLYKIGIPKNFHVVTLKNLLVYLAIILIAVFISVPSKEFITFIYITWIVLMYKNRKRKLKTVLLISFTLLFFFAYFFRQYFALVVLLAISMYLVSLINFKIKRVTTIVSAIIIVIGFSLSYGIVKGRFISEDSRHAFNERRIEKDSKNANSMIRPPLDPDTWYGESFGIVYGFFSVNLPFNGLKHFRSPQILAFIIWQTFLIIILFFRYKRSMKEGRNENYELWLFYMLFSYFVVQGVFEPDLGSAVRHKIGILPLIYYLLYYEDFRKKLS